MKTEPMIQSTTPEGSAVPPPSTPPPSPAPRKAARKGGGLWMWLIFALIAAAVIWKLGFAPRTRAADALEEDKRFASTRSVAVQSPQAPPVDTALNLPGRVEAFQQTSLYARAGGYVKRWLVDIGDQVKQGQLLLEIDTPELDQQLKQAQAGLAQAKAGLDLANLNANRWRTLGKEKTVSQQEVDEKVAAAATNQADFQAAAANVERLTELSGFRQIMAPFDGTVTARGVEVGTLIKTESSDRELYRIAQIDKLRVFVNVPQAYMRSIQVGQQAVISTREFGAQTFPGTVARTSNAIDDQSKTLLTEVDLQNPGALLLPGMYVQVRFSVKNPTSIVLIAPTALINKGDGTRVLVVDAEGKISVRNVQTGRDMGTQLEITSGLTATDKVVTNPTDDMREGVKVEIAESKKTQ